MPLKAGTAEIPIHPYVLVYTGLAEECEDINTSAGCLTLVLEREAKISVVIFMRNNTLEKKKEP